MTRAMTSEKTHIPETTKRQIWTYSIPVSPSQGPGSALHELHRQIDQQRTEYDEIHGLLAIIETQSHSTVVMPDHGVFLTAVVTARVERI